LLVDEHVVVLARQDGTAWAITATNNSPQPRTVEVRLPFEGGDLLDALDGTAIPVKDRTLTLTVPPLWGRVLVTPDARSP
jgi:cyclomaltodextrinase